MLRQHLVITARTAELGTVRTTDCKTFVGRSFADKGLFIASSEGDRGDAQHVRIAARIGEVVR